MRALTDAEGIVREERECQADGAVCAEAHREGSRARLRNRKACVAGAQKELGGTRKRIKLESRFGS